VTNKRWGVSGDQHWMTMGGFDHWQDEPGQRQLLLVNPPAPADRPAYLRGDAVAGLLAVPAQVTIDEPIEVVAQGATARFTLDSMGTEPTARLLYGTEDALTFADRWQNSTDVDAAQLGVNQVLLAGLTPATRYYYRVLIQNEEGQIWTLDTQTFETTP
jgi:hypothetical protein